MHEKGFELMKDPELFWLNRLSFCIRPACRWKSIKCSVSGEAGDLVYERTYNKFRNSDPLLKQLEKLAKILVRESGFIRPLPLFSEITYTAVHWHYLTLEVRMPIARKDISSSSLDVAFSKFVLDIDILDFSKDAVRQWERFKKSAHRYALKQMEKDGFA